MTITCYRSNQYRNTVTYETDEIFGNLDPDEMDDETRKQMQDGAEPMCCFVTEDGLAHCVPWAFVISIR